MAVSELPSNKAIGFPVSASSNDTVAKFKGRLRCEVVGEMETTFTARAWLFLSLTKAGKIRLNHHVVEQAAGCVKVLPLFRRQ